MIQNISRLFTITLIARMLVLQLCMATAMAAEVEDKVDWPGFLHRLDMVWARLPDKWGSGAFMGNGELGANVFTTDGGKSLHWRIGRSDVTMRGNRIPIGELALKTVGTLEGGDMRLDLWQAEVSGHVKTSKGEIRFRTFTHSRQMVQVIELDPGTGEKDCGFHWEPGAAADPRKIYQKTPMPDGEKCPAPQLTELDGVNVSTQALLDGFEHATAWTEIRDKDGRRVLYLSVGFGKEKGEAQKEAIANVRQAISTGMAELASSHRAWWHDYWPESFVSIPDTRLEAFYWLQMYKFASGTRANRPALDLMGPWFNTTPWAKIWWNLNIQLTYWPVLTGNRLELGESLCKLIDDHTNNLAKNAKKWSEDSSTIGRSASYDCARSGGSELCDFPWVMHNYYLQYRYSMDDAMLRDRIFPVLKRAMNYYYHNMKEGPDGRLHTTDGFSPEYPGQPTPDVDCNIDLALIRWCCQTLLGSCERLRFDDPLIPKWKDTLEKLTPYPTNQDGLMVSASVPFAQSHRHYSHLLMIYPLYIMTPEQPENRDLVIRSLNHWMGMPKALRGYSYTGAASISALLGRGDDALKYLNQLLDEKILPNTLYTEAGPCIETPLSGAASLNDMLLSSWGGKIRVLPGVPESWEEISFRDLRTQGAFLVSATRKDGRLQFIRIKSLAGEPCKLVTDMPNPVAEGAELRAAGKGEYDLEIRKGQTVLLVPKGQSTSLAIAPVPSQKDRENYFGVH